MTTLILSLLLACGGDTEAPHGHDHAATPAQPAVVEPVAPPADQQAEAAATPGATIEAPLGTYTARLEPSADALKLVVVDGEGKPVAAEGEAKVMLTGTGEEAQKVVLAASGDAWTGSAKAAGATGYLAVVNVTVGGHQESARLTWGDVPEAKAAPAPHAHEEGGHDHGEGGHKH
jgi:hypothetical protein